MIDNGHGALAGTVAIVTALADAGTRVVFGLPGGGPNLDVVGAAAAAGMLPSGGTPSAAEEAGTEPARLRPERSGWHSCRRPARWLP